MVMVLIMADMAAMAVTDMEAMLAMEAMAVMEATEAMAATQAIIIEVLIKKTSNRTKCSYSHFLYIFLSISCIREII